MYEEVIESRDLTGVQGQACEVKMIGTFLEDGRGKESH